MEYCSDLKATAAQCATTLSVMRMDYKVFPETQIVVFGPDFPMAYKKCAVFDKNNWACDVGSEIADKEMRVMSGIFSDNRSMKQDTQISRVRYLLFKTLHADFS